MMKTSGNTILVTGGTSGIGLSLARALMAAGNTVIIAGRREGHLRAAMAETPGLIGLALDMDDAAGIAAFAALVVRDYPALNVVINNAGIMQAENLRDAAPSLAIAEATVTTNILGPIRMIAALIGHLQTKPAATIINVTSGLAFVPLAMTPTYSASKAALRSYTQSLRAQMKDTSVEVLELAPPAVQTDLMPGSATNPQYMPLADFVSETMGLLQAAAGPEILVDRVKFLRNAEREGRYDAVFGMLNGGH
jgi:uncharacterized oxidoreductase